MQPNEFCYWLQGFFELSGANIALNDSQIAVVKEHLQLVIHRETLKETTNVVIPQYQQRREDAYKVTSPLGDIPNFVGHYNTRASEIDPIPFGVWEGSC